MSDRLKDALTTLAQAEQHLRDVFEEEYPKGKGVKIDAHPEPPLLGVVLSFDSNYDDNMSGIGNACTVLLLDGRKTVIDARRFIEPI